MLQNIEIENVLWRQPIMEKPRQKVRLNLIGEHFLVADLLKDLINLIKQEIKLLNFG